MDEQIRNLLVKNNSLLERIEASLIAISAKLTEEKQMTFRTDCHNAMLESDDALKALRRRKSAVTFDSVKKKYKAIGRGIVAEGFWKGHCETLDIMFHGYPMGCMKYLKEGRADFQQFIDILKTDHGYKDSRSRVAQKLDDVLRDNKINLKTETLKSFYKRKQGKRYSSLKITEEDFFLTMKALKLDTQILEENSKIDEFPAFKYHFAKLTDEEMQKAENVFFEDAVMASQREIFGKS
jgi:hypothetical protein